MHENSNSPLQKWMEVPCRATKHCMIVPYCIKQVPGWQTVNCQHASQWMLWAHSHRTVHWLQAGQWRKHTGILDLQCFKFYNRTKKCARLLLSRCHVFCVATCMQYERRHINFLNITSHVMHQQFNIQQLYALPTLYLCVLYLSEKKRWLVPLTA